MGNKTLTIGVCLESTLQREAPGVLWCSVEITYKKTISERRVITFSVSSSAEPSNPRDTFADSSPRLLLFKVVLTINPRSNLFKSPLQQKAMF